MIKEVFAAFPPDAAAGPQRFRGQAAMGEQTARWDLAIAGEQPMPGLTPRPLPAG